MSRFVKPPDNVVVYAIIDGKSYRVWRIDWVRRRAECDRNGIECWESFNILKLEFNFGEKEKP